MHLSYQDPDLTRTYEADADNISDLEKSRQDLVVKSNEEDPNGDKELIKDEAAVALRAILYCHFLSGPDVDVVKDES